MKKNRIWVLACILFVLLLAAGTRAQASELPAVSTGQSLTVYPWKKGRVIVYTDSTMKTKKEYLPYGPLKIVQVKGTAVKISYKSEGESRRGWVSLKRVLYDADCQAVNAYAYTRSFSLLNRPGGEPYVTVPLYAGGEKVGQYGGWVQVYFKIDGTYKMGWISQETYSDCVRESMVVSAQLLARGYYTISPKADSAYCLTYDAEKQSLKLGKKTGDESQLFLMEHQGNNQYTLTCRANKKKLARAADGSLTLDGAGSLWLLDRADACFTLTEVESGKQLATSKGTAALAKAAKKDSRRWVFTKTAVTPSKKNVTVFSQYDPKWGGETYCAGAQRRTISTSGCGLLALTNAIYALNGEFIDPTETAQFSVSRGHYFYMQGTSDTLYPDVSSQWGSRYHFLYSGKTTSLNTLRRHIKSGGTAVALVPGHYIAIVAYRARDNSFLVLDSAMSARRPTTIGGDWISAGTLTGSGNLHCEYYHMFSRKS